MDTPLQQLKSGNISQAESSVGKSNQMLYYLEQATLLRMSDKYSQSNQAFTSGQATIDAWISSYHNGTMGQVSDTLTASLVNDKAVDYIPKDYEKVMIPTYKALNDVSLGNMDNARIEITRMYNIEDIIQNFRDMQYAKLEAASKANEDTTKNYANLAQVESSGGSNYDFLAVNSPQVLALRNSYQNAFSHYLAGFIFEALGEQSLARPGYLKALELSPQNNLIKQSIKNIDNNVKPDSSSTDLLLVEEVGYAPQLKSVSIPVPFSTTNGQNNSCIHAVTIAFPELVPDKTYYGNVNVTIDGSVQQPLLFTDFNLMAARHLHDDLPNIFLRNLLRASKDLALQQSACNNGGSIVGLLATVSGVVLGSADERTWVTLPSKVYVSRVKLKRGSHTIQVATAGGMQNLTINLSKAYQVLSYRVIGASIYFSPEQAMVATVQ